MKKPKQKILTFQQCVAILAADQLKMKHVMDGIQNPDELIFGDKKSVAEFEKIIKSAVRKGELKPNPGSNNNPTFNLEEFYRWTKTQKFFLNVLVKEELDKEIIEMNEKNKLWEFHQRHTDSCKRKIDEDKLKLLVKKPLWELPGGLMLLDGFDPYESYAMNEKCVHSDEKMNWLYQCAFDAYEKGDLKLRNKEKIMIPHGRTAIYRIDPKDLIKFVADMDVQLYFLLKAQKYLKDITAESGTVHHKTKESYLKIIYVFLKKHVDKYSPDVNNNETKKIKEILERGGQSLDVQTIRSILKECQDRFIKTKN